MQDHPNIDYAHRLWSAAAEGDADAMRDLLTDDVVWTVRGDHPLSGDYRGPEEVLDYLASVGERADELRSELLDVYVNDNGAVITYNVVARRELKRLDMDYLLELRTRGGRLIRAQTVAVDQQATNLFWQ